MAGLAAAFGSGAMTNPIADIEEAKVLLVTGSNTTENHPVLAAYVKRAVKHKGAKLIVVDPRRIPLTRHATLWLRPQPGTDVAWINGMLHVIIEEGLLRRGVRRRRARRGSTRSGRCVAKYTPEYVEGITGIPAADLVAAARLFASVPAASILYTMGITQHVTGTDNVKSLANLAHALRQRRRARRRRQPAARPEQRAGRLRHGRAAERLHRLPAGGEARSARPLRGGLGDHRPARESPA